MKEHMVYILECKDGTYYTGYTNDFDRRIKAHETGRGAKYTRGRGPFIVRHQETYSTKEEAMKREAFIKKFTRAEKEKLIREGSHPNGTEKLSE
ncbi:GIY-YIG nuclease family protein [Pullulanibacillus sp. KACC 23026]|uniref:GIY-YIG nuclease family protein n=1 Tax=Pullulanibacillus sp. KACC 23026 TaxID=3028315 RepID=UPI0023B1E3F1|nr:GIY-YIG nuclease family protein [Pullulanibacillus sp. KACC 23026]WEG12747.1 GIY-YIG nuclease family protein [Pullulanibacillus sp. KACC 23026]